MKLTREQLLLATLAYADIFRFPLKREELVLWSLWDKTCAAPELVEQAKQRSFIQEKQGYVFLSGNNYIGLRLRREKNARVKWAIARRVGRWLRFIPTITLLGVTGGLALNNADEDDDIDLFFIVQTGTLWVSRLLAITTAELLGIRRRPGDREVKNKICLNMFMASDAVTLPRNERDVFAAHEILQMEPLWEQRGTHRRFLQANRWVARFLPKAWDYKTQITSSKFQLGNKYGELKDYILDIVIWILRFAELPVKVVQLWYMCRHRTTEVISGGVLRFHPADARVRVKRELGRRLLRYKIPLDKIFRAR